MKYEMCISTNGIVVPNLRENSKIQNGRHKQRSGQHIEAQQKIRYTTKKFTEVDIAGSKNEKIV
jgi:hypothetical protein